MKKESYKNITMAYWLLLVYWHG